MIRATTQQIEDLIAMSNANANQPLPVRKVAKSKYRAVPVDVNGKNFDSKAEAERYAVLEIMQRTGAIRDLRQHPVYKIVVNDVLICKYEGDSVYVENGELVVEDVKGMKTPVYRLKKKLMLAVWGIKIREITKPKRKRK